MKTVIAGAVGECVHVAGVVNFLRLAEAAGWRTVFLGPSVSAEDLEKAIRCEKPDLVGISYRLTPETGEQLLSELAEKLDEYRSTGVRFAFGGTPPMARRAQKMGFFERVFEGGEGEEQVLAYLNELETGHSHTESHPQSIIERMRWKSPFPLLRHHFGLPTIEDTLKGIEMIARQEALDVISLGIDQDAQENFFHPERQVLRRKGAGGVPVRTAEDFRNLFQASRQGNFPLMRTYSGTDNFIPFAEILLQTIHNAWCAIPLFWFNQMDGRGPWDLEGSIRQHQEVMAWYAQRNIPVELNEPHHWGMRDAPDVICVVSAFLAAYNARYFGVRDLIAQFMFNSPPGLSDAMDLAKMLAMVKIIEPLQNDCFRIWRQTRTGLLSYPVNANAARSHLATSIYLQMALKPHIVHVVGHTEADHAATAEDVIEACQIARRAIETAIKGMPDMLADARIQERADHLVHEAQVTLQAIYNLAGTSTIDPWVDPSTLARSVQTGILDAPHLRNNPFAPGRIQTRIIHGCCETINSSGEPISESERLETSMKPGGKNE